MVRSVPADAGDSYLCMLLAHAAAHGAMAGYTGFTVGLVKNKSVMIPIPELARSVTQRDFQPFPNFNFASMASTRCHTAVAPSTWPCECLRVA